jgi:glucosylglycerate synthase
MTELDIPQDVKGRIEQIGGADLVIGLPDCGSGPDVADAAIKIQDASKKFSPVPKIVLVHSYGAAAPEANGNLAQAEPDENLRFLPIPQADPLLASANSTGGTYGDVLTVCRLLGGKACAVLASELESITPESLRRLAQPVLDRSSDLIVACYPRHKFESLINSSIVYPLIRALYGKRVQWPMARDFGFSERAVDRFLATTNGARGGSAAWMVLEAVNGGLQIAQANLSTRPQPLKGTEDVSSVLALVLSPIFLNVERNAPFWQKVRGSQSVPTFGAQPSSPEESSPVDVTRMVESFQLGFRDLREIWNLVLPPAALIGLKKLTDLPPDRFQMPDELWARTIYDFVLGFRLRAMNRDHLLRALTPLYLGWVASYALEMQSASTDEVEERIERLCSVFEAQKPYLQSRWRWPDRFNP